MLRAKYTENYPDVLSAKKAISDLEKEIAHADKESAAGAASSSAQGTEEVFDPQAAFIKELEGQLAVTENEIQTLKKEESKIRGNIVIYQGRVENAPLRELMMTNLSRGYETAKENYRRL